MRSIDARTYKENRPNVNYWSVSESNNPRTQLAHKIKLYCAAARHHHATSRIPARIVRKPITQNIADPAASLSLNPRPSNLTGQELISSKATIRNADKPAKGTAMLVSIWSTKNLFNAVSNAKAAIKKLK